MVGRVYSSKHSWDHYFIYGENSQGVIQQYKQRNRKNKRKKFHGHGQQCDWGEVRGGAEGW